MIHYLCENVFLMEGKWSWKELNSKWSILTLCCLFLQWNSECLSKKKIYILSPTIAGFRLYPLFPLSACFIYNITCFELLGQVVEDVMVTGAAPSLSAISFPNLLVRDPQVYLWSLLVVTTLSQCLRSIKNHKAFYCECGGVQLLYYLHNM